MKKWKLFLQSQYRQKGLRSCCWHCSKCFNEGQGLKACELELCVKINLKLLRSNLNINWAACHWNGNA